MAVNRDKVDLWKSDVARSVDFYNEALAKPPRDMGVPPMKHG